VVDCKEGPPPQSPLVNCRKQEWKRARTKRAFVGACVTLAANCVLLDDSDYGFPPAIRKLQPCTIDTSCNHVCIDSFGIATFSIRQSKSVITLWHNRKIDITTLPVVRAIKANCFKVQYDGNLATAKFARFDWEIRFIEVETAIYQTINQHNIAPKFLA